MTDSSKERESERLPLRTGDGAAAARAVARSDPDKAMHILLKYPEILSDPETCDHLMAVLANATITAGPPRARKNDAMLGTFMPDWYLVPVFCSSSDEPASDPILSYTPDAISDYLTVNMDSSLAPGFRRRFVLIPNTGEASFQDQASAQANNSAVLDELSENSLVAHRAYRQALSRVVDERVAEVLACNLALCILTDEESTRRILKQSPEEFVPDTGGAIARLTPLWQRFPQSHLLGRLITLLWWAARRHTEALETADLLRRLYRDEDTALLVACLCAYHSGRLDEVPEILYANPQRSESCYSLLVLLIRAMNATLYLNPLEMVGVATLKDRYTWVSSHVTLLTDLAPTQLEAAISLHMANAYVRDAHEMSRTLCTTTPVARETIRGERTITICEDCGKELICRYQPESGEYGSLACPLCGGRGVFTAIPDTADQQVSHERPVSVVRHPSRKRQLVCAECDSVFAEEDLQDQDESSFEGCAAHGRRSLMWLPVPAEIEALFAP